MEIITGVFYIIVAIVFFVIASNIGNLVALAKKNEKQNEEIIRLLGGGNPKDRVFEKELLTAKEIHDRAKTRRYKDT